MKSKITSVLFLLLTLVLAEGGVKAQRTKPSPTPTPTPTNGDEIDWGGYTVTSNLEVGVRGLSVKGDDNKYRSDLNYSAGVRLFDSSLLLRAKEGQGKYFDNFMINTTGFGGDPNGYVRINAEKAGWYRFDGSARRFTYNNFIRTIALGQHAWDTRHRFSDFDLTLLPENERIRFNLGYSRDAEDGAAATTYDYSRNEFPILEHYRTQANNFRLGADAKWWVFDLSFLQGFRYSRDDTTYFIASPQPGNNVSRTALTTLGRDLPTRGRVAFTRFSAHTLIRKRLDFTGRFIYTSSTTHFNFIENLRGSDFTGNRVNLDQFTGSGDAKRPNGMGDVGVTWLATKKLRVSDTFRVNSFRITGGDLLNELLLRSRSNGAPLPPSSVASFGYRITRYRQYSNLVEADYQFSKNYSAHVGYRYTNRHIELNGIDQNLAQPLGAIGLPDVFDNHTNGVIAGFKARPVPVWTVYFDFEKGTADNVFTRLANYDVTNFRARTRLAATKSFSLNASVVTKNNSNPSFTEDLRLTPTAPLQNLTVDTKTRIFSSSVDWTPNGRYSFSAGYTRTNVTSNSGVLLFVNNAEQVGSSQYFMKDNFFFLSVFAQPVPRLSFYAGYRINKDPGQGNLVAATTNTIISSVPINFQNPEARVAFKISRRVEWNVGYQYYAYNERFLSTQNVLLNNLNVPPSNVSPQNYHAHLPYTSLRIFFGRREE